jgi:hypothetical protein
VDVSFAAETPANETGPAASRRRRAGCPQGVGVFETPPLTAFRKGNFLCAFCASAVSAAIFLRPSIGIAARLVKFHSSEI